MVPKHFQPSQGPMAGHSPLMGHVILRFYGPLNDFLPRALRHRVLLRKLRGRVSVKDLVESVGPPHPEISLLLVDGLSVPFSHLVLPGSTISAYPHCYSLDLRELSLVLPEPLAPVRFVVDGHLARLAGFLRALGYDTAYGRDWDDAELARISHDERRILLTRDVGLLRRRAVSHGYWVRSLEREEQLRELVERFSLGPSARPFSRCMRCNGLLGPVEKSLVAQELPPGIRARHRTFRRCVACGKLYWRGSHYDRIAQLIRAVGVAVA